MDYTKKDDTQMDDTNKDDPNKSEPKTPAPKKEAAKPEAKPKKAAFELTGQKYETPDEQDGTRRFYESLLRQKPDSLMAMKWCVEYGVLDEAHAKSILNKLEKKKAVKK